MVLALMLVPFLAQIRASRQRMADPVYRQQLSDAQCRGTAANETGGCVVIFVIGMLAMAGCAWTLLFMNPGEGLEKMMWAGSAAGGLTMLWSLIGLVPVWLEEKRWRQPAVLVVLPLAVAAGVFYAWDSDRGRAVPGDDLVALLDKDAYGPETAAVRAKLGRRDVNTGWERHGLMVSTINYSTIGELTFGLDDPMRPQIPYAGPLPFGLKQGDTPAQVREKLGAAGEEGEDIGRTKWTFAKRGITVRFAGGGLSSVSVLAPSQVRAPLDGKSPSLAYR